MACIYYYKGNYIGTELQLNDFLIEKKQYYSKYGDVVFQRSVLMSHTIDTIEKKIIPASQAIKTAADEMWANGGKLYDEDGDKVIYDTEHPLFVGVNKYINKFGATTNERLVPEFIPKEYWNKIFSQWKDHKITDDSTALLDILSEVKKEDIKAYIANLTTILSDETLSEWREIIENKWKVQGEIGTAIHAVSEYYFDKNGQDYNYKNIDENVDEAYNTFIKNYASEAKYITIDVFKKAITMCQKLKKDLQEQYGENCVFYSEIAMSCKTQQKVAGSENIYGIVDLLVIDESGVPHLIDYKTSNKPYHKFNSAKKLSYTYQLAVYERILANYGIKTDKSTSTIIPIQIEDMKWDGNKWVYESINYSIENNNDVAQEPLYKVDNEKIQNNIDKFLPVATELSLSTENLMDNVYKSTKVLFPNYQVTRSYSDEELSQYLRSKGAFDINSKTGDYRFEFPYSREPIVVEASDSNPELTMFTKAKQEIESWPQKTQKLVNRVKNILEDEQKKDSGNFTWRERVKSDGDPLWLQQTMSQYCNKDWKVIECPGIEYFGMILLQNTNTNLVTVLKLTSAPNILEEVKINKNRKNLTGKYEEDVVENSKSDSRMLKSVRGNVELMEAMLVLQNIQLESNQHLSIQEFKLIQPYRQESLPASNKEILYSFNKLMNLAKNNNEDINLDVSNFTGKDAKISLISPYELIKRKFTEILRQQRDGKRILNKDITKKVEDFLQSPINEFTNPTEIIDPDSAYKELSKLAQAWESEEGYKDSVSVVRTYIKDVLSPEYQLYSDIMIAMNDLKNIDVRQQIKDADKWLETTHILRDGMEGLYIENPGNFKSQTLNQITASIGNAFQKVRDSMNRRKFKLRTLVQKLKEEKNYGYIKNNLTGNPTSLYANMIEERNGDLVFVNPDTLYGAEKEFLEYVLQVINENRYPKDVASFESWKQSGDMRYYRVPLMRASDASKMTTEGNLKAFKDRCKTWTISGAWQELKEKTQGFFSAEEEQLAYAKENIFKMTNVFNWGESEERLDKIAKAGGVNAFEHNLEDLLLNHCFAYDVSKEMREEMPRIKASAIALGVQGAYQNTREAVGGFKNLQEFIEDYIQNKIKGYSITDPKYRKFEGAVGKARKLASFMSLAFSPLQFTYQTVEGIWKAIALIIKKPDGTNAFSVKNMWKSFKHVYKELANYSDTPSFLQQINETYGINDMDSQQFAKRLSSNQGFLVNLEDWAFRMASRPDFYNRMTIFESQMREDGSFEAHEIVNGELVYNYKKDKRYEAMFTQPKGSDAYNKAYSNYLTALKQFREEGVVIQNGDPLPRAYTNKEATAMKVIADNIYGYYNNETKAMLGSTLLGGLVMQMKTYWPAKKNQYLAPGGVKLMGHWEDYQEQDENGVLKQCYYQKTDTGEIDTQKPFVFEDDPNCSMVKAQQWKGQWQEGIMSTMWKLGESAVNGRFLSEWHNLWYHPDDNLRTAYRSNIKHAIIDLVVVAIIGNITAMLLGDWSDDEEKEWHKDKGNVGKASEYMFANFVYKTFDNSFRDFNALKSIFDPALDWQPMAINTLWTNTSRILDSVVGDEDFSRSVLRSFTVGRLASPLFDSLTYEEK